MVIGLMLVAMLAMAPIDRDMDPRLERDVLVELNRARADPQAYADELRDYREGFDGPVAYSRETPDGIMTREGVAAVDEAIAFLERQPARGPLAASALLALGAGDLVADQAGTRRVGHITSTGRNPSDRVKQRGGGIYVAEVITYGPPDPISVVRQLIVDDGVRGRGHRALVFSATHRFAGVACGPHGTYVAVCTVDLAATPDGRPALSASADPVAPASEPEGKP